MFLKLIISAIFFCLFACTEEKQNGLTVKTIDQTFSLSNTDLSYDLHGRWQLFDSMLLRSSASDKHLLQETDLRNASKAVRDLISNLKGGLLKDVGFDPTNGSIDIDEENQAVVYGYFNKKGKDLYDRLFKFENQIYASDSAFYNKNRRRLPLSIPHGGESITGDNFSKLLFKNISPLSALALLSAFENRVLMTEEMYLEHCLDNLANKR